MGCASSVETQESRRSIATMTSSQEDETTLVVDYNGEGALENNDDSKYVLEWRAEYPTTKYHWWPQLDRDADEEDCINNLFAKGTGLDLYDQLFGTKSIEYQRENHRIEKKSKRTDKYWAGFCDRAASLSCLYVYPKHAITVEYNNRKLTFEPRQIETLMIVASDNATRQGLSNMYGVRNNLKKTYEGIPEEEYQNFYQEHQNEPYPLELLEILKRFSMEPEPFVMDIDNGESVWNYSFDAFKVSNITDDHDYDLQKLPQTGNNTLYRFEIQSQAFPQKNMTIDGYVNENDSCIEQGWLSDKNPDFLWKEYRHLGPWKGRCQMNPEISARNVYRIYRASIAEIPRMIEFVN